VSQFTFRLERVRALRERSEDLAKQELAGAMSRRGACEERLRATGVELDSARDKQRDLVAAGASAQDLIARQLYLERVERNRTLGQQELVASEAEVQNRRGLLVEAARERQALERLKERSRLDHARELARVEGANMDEIALTLHRRRMA
jgi:flagellar FliJ protein